MPRRARASSARLDKLKHVQRGVSFSLPSRATAGDSPALACGPPRAMKLSLRCSSTERRFSPILQVPLRSAHQANHLIEEASLTL
jgi:hypothetical protein